MSDSKKASYRPDRSELHHLYNSQTMKWALTQLQRQYPSLPSWTLAPSWEEQHRLAGQQQVLHSLHKLFNPE